MRPRITFAGRLLVATLAVATTAGCDWTKPKVPGAEQRTAARRLAEARRLQQACGSARTYDRLKALTFDQANAVRTGGPLALDPIEASSTVRMERPVATSRNEQLDITVCAGHLVLDLPPGVASALDGRRRLEADVEYSAQAAADGSGLVYQMRGAEPIVYGLASMTLPEGAGRAPVETAGPAAAPPAPAPPSARHVSAPSARPAPAKVSAAPLAPPEPRRDPPRVAERDPASVPSARPSFDCGRVTSRVLRLVCADPALAARDRDMSSRFYAGLASSDGETRAALRASRDRFLSTRGRCSTAACVAQAYDDRTAEIRDIVDGR